MNAAVYPRIASEGVLTFVHWKATFLNQWFALDIEYCTWANPKSEIMFFGDPEKESEGCGESELKEGHGKCGCDGHSRLR